MKIFLLFLTICFALANAQLYYDKHGECRGTYKDSLDHATLVKFAEKIRGPILVKKSVEGVKPTKSLKRIKRTLNVSRDTLDKENWLEVEKNEIVKICADQKVLAWETSLSSNIKNDSCLAIQAPTLIGVDTLKVYFPDSDSSHKINLAVGMKYLDFKNEEVLLGYNEYDSSLGFDSSYDLEYDPERLVSVTGTYLVDKYPVTNCEFLQLLQKEIPEKNTFSKSHYKRKLEEWIIRKKRWKENEKCMVHDTAVTTSYLYQSMMYANARSIREGLKPYYVFSETEADESAVLAGYSKAISYIIGYHDFTEHEKKFIAVKVDSSSDGYRLLYYDEWMMFARGGDKKNKAPWGDSSATFKEASKHAKFKSMNRDFFHSEKEMVLSEPVGQLQPNGYGLYDIFGLVSEQVLLENSRCLNTPLGFFCFNFNFPYCLKGGTYYVTETRSIDNSHMPYWKYFNYGSFEYGYPGIADGFRLVRNIGNNAKWSEIKTVGKE
jgi:formylglycine-generating enzyme required for sulfatase activity